MVQALLDGQGVRMFCYRPPGSVSWLGYFGMSLGYTDIHSLCTFERPCSTVYPKRAFELDTFDRTKALDPAT